MSKQTLLIELGTEELPPKTLRKLSAAFAKELLSGMLTAQLISEADADAASAFATPRRLALSVPNVVSAQPDQTIERRGPAVEAAFNDDGNATPAALGFAKSCGVDISDLARLKTDKGEWLSYNMQQIGKTIADLIPEIIDQTIKRLPIAKRMRWGDSDAEFVRPVKWLIVMHGNVILPATALDVAASNTTRGHRFHSDGDLIIGDSNEYQQHLLDKGQVIASFANRQAMIVDQINSLAQSVKGFIQPDQPLLDEVTGLVEYPTAILGTFDAEFLQVPQECLISSMRDHQKYFHIVDANEKLLPYFITVSNIQSKDPARVSAGNERVLRARLSDARFFWETDQKTHLEDRVNKLENVLFHIKLGSILDKTKRIQALAAKIADDIGADCAAVERSALLAKADLVSNMVNEFDELQGVMGHYYADLDGEASLVGDCIEQHYWPKFAGDQLPATPEAQALALADKLDSLVGIYSAGEVPTGDKDPYALRRAALSILRILIERQHAFTLSDLIAHSATSYKNIQGIEIDTDTQSNIANFIRGRLTSFYQSQSIATSTINSVMACKPDSPLDFEQRLKAVHAFGKMTEAVDLASANKRISNLLKKEGNKVSGTIDESALVEKAEQNLHQAITTIERDCLGMFDAGDYAQGLKKLASLRTPVDSFFEHVMVMSDDKIQRQNRLNLLSRIQNLFMRVADIALLQA